MAKTLDQIREDVEGYRDEQKQIMEEHQSIADEARAAYEQAERVVAALDAAKTWQ